MSQRSDPFVEAAPPDARVALLERYFLNRTDVLAVKRPSGAPGPIALPSPVQAALAAHVLGKGAPEVEVEFISSGVACGRGRGRFRLGSYTPAPDGNTGWLCLDFDGAGHSDALTDPLAAALATVAAFKAYGIATHLERSGGGAGWHLWCFFVPPVAARDGRALALALVPRDLPLARGGCADPAAGRGVEVFPKQDRITTGGLGNMVWLPFWSGAPDGANSFYSVTP